MEPIVNICSPKYNSSIDIIKGGLILLVILGHIILGDLDSNIIRFIIYSFHMPIFFFISGYLLNIEKIKNLSNKKFILKYWHRMLKEWTIAWFIYTMGYCIYNGFSIHSVIYNITNPYYHLWYVPSIFISIVLVRIILKNIENKIVSFLTLFCLGIFLYNITNYYDIGQAYNCRLLIFLILGIISQSTFKNIKGKYFEYSLIYLLLIIGIFYYFSSATYFYRTYVQMPLCILLSILIFYPLIEMKKLHQNQLEWLGRNSLSIYLWHVLPIIILKKLIEDNTLIYYIASFTILLIFLLFVYSKSERKTNLISH